MVSSAPLSAHGLLNQRFHIEAELGRGGMGRVLRALDLHSGKRVAIKILHGHAQQERFQREVAIMAALSHPAIVSYIDQGVTLEGRPFMVMEWLEGEDLAQRLQRGGCSLRESLTVIRHAAEALRAAHHHGIVHLDIKPGNLFLRARQSDRVALLDFGIAHQLTAQSRLTQTGQVLGTPQYMSPEQVQGEHIIGPASDIFSLGCVLFECLTGQVPYPGRHLAVVLGKILAGQIPPLRQVRPDLSLEAEVLDSLLARMLAKDLAVRFPHVEDLLAALENLPPLPDLPAPQRLESEPVLAAPQEQRLVSVVMALPPGACGAELGTMEIDSGASLRQGSRSHHLDSQELTVVLAPAGVQIEQLADGSVILTASAADEMPVDPVVRAARCAFLLKDRMPQLRIALATGRGLLHQRIPQGEVMDRIEAVLSHVQAAESDLPDGVWADEVSGHLLEARYAMYRLGQNYLLQGERGRGEDSRALLGKASPCVGRERELALLDGLVQECRDDAVARAALILAPAGAGKSRLRHEFVRRLRERESNTQVVMACADVMRVGASYGLMSDALRNLCGIAEGEPLPERQYKLRACVQRYAADADVERLTVFLGELCDCQFSENQSPALRAARQDPRRLGTQIEQALLDLLRAVTREHPMVLILEDLHWGDALTVRIIGEALRSLAEQSLFVLALARPEVNQIFPDLWVDCARQEIRLPGLPRKACDRLIEHALGDKILSADRARLAAQAGGNALLLEELIREAAAGRISDQPATALAILQARIDRLPSQARRILRAASVYGEVFWRGGISAVLAEDTTSEEVDPWLDILYQHEMIERHRDSRFGGEVEYRFRHALIHDAAYGLLTDEDRQRCHFAALEYLSALQDSDPLVLAGHAERSGRRDRAATYYAAAVRHAYNCNDLENAVAYAPRAIACGASGELFGELRYIQTYCAIHRGQLDEVALLSQDVLNTVTPYGELWCKVQRLVFLFVFYKGSQEEFSNQALHYIRCEPLPPARGHYVSTGATLLGLTCQRGLMLLVTALNERLDELERQISKDESLTVYTFLTYNRCDSIRSTQVDPASLFYHADEAYKASQIVLPKTEQIYMEINRGYVLGEMGDLPNAIRILRELEGRSKKAHNRLANNFAQIHLAALLMQSEVPENLVEASSMLVRLQELPGLTVGYRGWVHGMLGQLALLRGDMNLAEKEARSGMSILGLRPFLHLLAHATLIAALRARGRAKEASCEAEKALVVLHNLSERSYPALPLLVEAGQAYYDNGDLLRAHSALLACLAEIQRRANLLPGSEARARFLTGIPAHRRAAVLAKLWGLPAASTYQNC